MTTGYGNCSSASEVTRAQHIICRRLQDIIEKSDDPLTMIFLDWEKAFDKVYQDELVNAVRRMNIQEKW